MNTHECIIRLQANADVFRAMLQGVTPEQVRWKPSSGEWSLLEVINHLADEEVEDFRTRLRLTLEAPDRDWPPIDPERWVFERRYNQRDLKESQERFVAARLESARWLQTFPSLDMNATHTHPQIGSMRAGDLVHAWLAHDQLHIRQMNRLHYQFLAENRGEYLIQYAGEW
jgi:hypothetical protein